MHSEYYLVYLLTCLHGVVLFTSPVTVRPLGVMLLISSVYYSVLGPWYWVTFQGSSFLGVFWGDELPQAAIAIASGALLTFVSATAFSLLLQRATKFDPSAQVLHFTEQESNSGASLTSFPRSLVDVWRFFFMLGAVSSFFLLGKISSNQLSGLGSGGFLLIAYQLSDVLIPTILFGLAASRFRKTQIIVLIGFIGYALVIGFRYKLALLLLPLLMATALPIKRTKRFNLPSAVLFTGFLLLLFSIMTVARSKFSGLDISAIGESSVESFLYGLFAESNILFGMIGVLEAVSREDFIGLAPLTNTALEMIPRFLFPSRVTGEYLSIPILNLIAPEAIDSATAFPSSGELLLIAGWPSLVAGCAAVGLCYVVLSHAMCRVLPQLPEVVNVGHGLLAIYFGYYFFSRGYLPQTFKAFVCVVLPYLLFIHLSSRKTH